MSICNCEPETPGILECGLGCACRCHELEAQLAAMWERAGRAESAVGSEAWNAIKARAQALEEAAKVADELADIEDGDLVGHAPDCRLKKALGEGL